MFRILLVATLFAAPAAAQKAPEAISPGDVISAVVGEWTADGRPDHAVLVRRGFDEIDLYLYTSDSTPEDAHRVKLAAYAPGFTTASNDNDDTLELQTPDYTSLQVYTEYLKGGNETVKISFRNGQFVVSGYTFYYYDNTSSKEYDCDINLLTGKGILDKKPVKVAVGGIPLANWTFQKAYEICPR